MPPHSGASNNGTSTSFTSSSRSNSNSSSTATTTTSSSSRVAQGTCDSMHDSSIGCTSLAVQQSEQHARLASLCTAWQQSLPHLAALTEAAVRSGMQSEPQIVLQCGLAYGLLNKLCDQGLFVASDLQPGSPAVKPLCGLTTTLVKLAAVVLSKPVITEQEGIQAGVNFLSISLRVTSLVLQTACATSSSDRISSSGAVIGMPSKSKVSATWHVAPRFPLCHQQ